jgi:hypothetical protein
LPEMIRLISSRSFTTCDCARTFRSMVSSVVANACDRTSTLRRQTMPWRKQVTIRQPNADPVGADRQALRACVTHGLKSLSVRPRGDARRPLQPSSVALSLVQHARRMITTNSLPRWSPNRRFGHVLHHKAMFRTCGASLPLFEYRAQLLCGEQVLRARERLLGANRASIEITRQRRPNISISTDDSSTRA